MSGSALRKNAAEVAAANLADFIRRKTLFQHFAGDRIKQAGVLVWPDLVAVWKNIGCCEVCIGANADMIDTHSIDCSLDRRDIFFQCVDQTPPYTDNG